MRSASARFLGGLGHAIYKAAADFMAAHKSEIIAAAKASAQARRAPRSDGAPVELMVMGT